MVEQRNRSDWNWVNGDVYWQIGKREVQTTPHTLSIEVQAGNKPYIISVQLI